MAKIEKDTLEFLGFDYQYKLLAQLLTDKRFANSIIDIIDANYFKDEHLKIITAAIKDAKEEYDIIPDYSSIEFRLLEKITNPQTRKFILGQLKRIRETSLNDSYKVQEVAMKFCKTQELKKSIKQIAAIIDNGDTDEYEKCESILRKALEHGDNKDDGMNVLDDLESVLDEDFRKPIPTGIKGLDEIMDGGLSKGELAVILAPFGVGKTTMMTKICNTAMNEGHKVLQIFFEDMPRVIQRKHLACWSGHDLNSLVLHKDDLIDMAKNMTASSKNGTGEIKLKKFSSDGTTIPMIRQYIRQQIASGFRPDLITLDYIDCVTPSKKFDDVNAGEGAVMRQFEAMLAELDLAGWTAVQGNRSSISAEVVEANQMGGSIKKGQIGHFIVSIAKTLDQKDEGTATMAILKSRFGKDGMIFPNIVFDNARIQIEMGDAEPNGQNRTQYKKGVEDQAQNRVNAVMQARQTTKNN
jgi:replicative DNA helicase